MSKGMAIAAGIWLRVSDESQNEENQLPRLRQWCAERGYTVDEQRHLFRVHGKSAWKPGKLDADKRRVLRAFAEGQIKVLVVWAVDRWSREGIGDLFHGMRAVADAGGRVEFVMDTALNVDGPAQELLLAVLGWVAQMESKRRSDRTKEGLDRLRREGRLAGGSVPFGYRTAGGLRVRDEQALALVAEVFARSARGESTAVISAFLARRGVRRPASTIAAILRNPDYVADGVISGALAKAALSALDARRKGTVRLTHGGDYSAAVWCRCGRRMHRVLAGGSPAKGVQPTRYYRCKAHEGKPVPMVRADDADALIEQVMRADWLPWLVPVRTGGDTREADKARVWQELKKAHAQRAGREQVMALYDLLEAIGGEDPEPERTQWVPSGQTRGEHWAALTVPERRAWLDNEDTRIVLWNAAHEAGGSVERSAGGQSAWARGKVRMDLVHGPGVPR